MTNQTTHDYIARHTDDDVRKLALSSGRETNVDITFALQQIAGRQRAKAKLPTWAATEGITYPPQLSMEQCSSEQTARYKAQMAQRLMSDTSRLPSGPTRMADLTGGFGVDFWQLSQVFDRASYVEQDLQLCAISSENFRLLGLHNVETVCADGAAFLQQTDVIFDLVYIDPARRDSHGQRTYSILDCTPNVLSIRDLLHTKANMVMLKLSPMLDWRKAVGDVGHEWVKEVHIVSVANECKELLLVMDKAVRKDDLRLVCVNDDQVFETTISPQPSALRPPLSSLHSPYLYEPNASIMKAGCFSEVEQAFGVRQLAPNSHLFAATEYIADFPGRRFNVEAVTTMNKRELKPIIGNLKQANITIRNFPMSVDALRKRLKLGEGGNTYIFATTTAKNEHVLMFCKKD